MDKKTGMIVSIVGSIVCLCLAIACCSGGFYGTTSVESDFPYIWAIVGVCLGLVPIIGAVLLWVFLVVRNKEGEGPQLDI